MSANPHPRPAWQRQPLFKFFASIKLAVVLLAVLILGAIAGTIYESSFDAKVARAYIYGAAWFNLWLLLLVANLAASAFSRWPWRKHHVAFLITHLGIITLLAGSLIGRTWGVEGTMTLFKDDPPSTRLLVDQHQLRVRDTDGVIKGYAAEFIHHPPTPEKPRDLGRLASGARLSLTGFSTAVEGKLNPKPLTTGGLPALHFTIATAMMNQHLESWLIADDPRHSTFGMGLANIELKRGTAPAVPASEAKPATGGEVEIEETIFAFAKAPDEQIAKSMKGGSTGAKVQLDAPKNGDRGQVRVQLADRSWSFDVAQNLGRDAALDGTGFTLRIQNYWPDFRMANGQPGTLSEQPNNPAVMVILRGRGVPVAAAPNTHTGAPEMPAASAASPNHLTLFLADDGTISYELISRKLGHSAGPLTLKQLLTTGWADWQLIIDQTMPHAEPWTDFNALAEAPAGAELPEGVRVRVQQDGGSTFEQWVPAGWQITVPIKPAPVQISYGWKQIPLPIGLELTAFEVERNEGSDTPAGFKSTLRLSDAEGGSATGQCWMNHPFSYPGAAWRVWTGLTFKMSQASWNPDNLGQSTIQILRDPGWSLKWIGSLLIVTGIFMLFYLRGFRRPTPSSSQQTRANRKPAPIAAVHS